MCLFQSTHTHTRHSSTTCRYSISIIFHTSRTTRAPLNYLVTGEFPVIYQRARCMCRQRFGRVHAFIARFLFEPAVIPRRPLSSSKLAERLRVFLTSLDRVQKKIGRSFRELVDRVTSWLVALRVPVPSRYCDRR